MSSAHAHSDPPPAHQDSAPQPAAHRRICYWGSGSPQAWRVLLTLEEKGLEYESELISFESGVLKTAPFLALNPHGKVPILVDGDVTLYESLAIMLHLELTYPGGSLLPSDPMTRASVLVRMQEASSMTATGGEVIRYLRHTPAAEVDHDFVAKKRAALLRELQVWEHYVSEGGYLVGDTFTLADIAFFPGLAYLVRVGLEVDRCFPHLRRYFARVCRLESVLNTWPPHWRDSPGLSYLSTRGIKGPVGVPALDAVEENQAAEDDSVE